MRLRLLSFPFYGSSNRPLFFLSFGRKSFTVSLMSTWVDDVPTFAGFQYLPNADLLVTPFIGPGLEL